MKTMTKMKKMILSFSALVVIFSVVPTPVALAAPKDNCSGVQTSALFPAWYDGLLCDDGTIKSPKDFSGNTGEQFGTWLTVIAMNIVRMILYVVGYASLIFIIFGGFKYMTQGDNSSGTVAARKTIQNAIIGLVLSIMSVAIVTFIAGSIK